METETQVVADLIALNEKKVAMALDDLIKLSKRNIKGYKGGKRSRRARNKSRNFNGAARNNNNNNTSKEKHYVNSLSGVRQGAVAKTMSNFKGNQFPAATNVAHKAATGPPLSVRRRAINATSANQSRLRAPPVQNRSVHARYMAKRHEVEQKIENGGGKWKTLDSRFAIMKEQRNSSNNNNNNNNNSGSKGHAPRLPPWARARRF